MNDPRGSLIGRRLMRRAKIPRARADRIPATDMKELCESIEIIGGKQTGTAAGLMWARRHRAHLRLPPLIRVARPRACFPCDPHNVIQRARCGTCSQHGALWPEALSRGPRVLFIGTGAVGQKSLITEEHQKAAGRRVH